MNLLYDNDGTGVNTHLGKYNFNNEKSENVTIHGSEGVEGLNDEAALNGRRNKCIRLEFPNNSETLCLFGTTDISPFDDALELHFKTDITWADTREDDRTAVTRLQNQTDSCKDDPARFLAEYNQYFGNDSLFAWYLTTSYFMAVDNRAKNVMLVTWDGLIQYFLPYGMDMLFGVRNDSVLEYEYTTTHESFDDSTDSYAFTGYDPVLQELVRFCPDKLREAARTLRSNISLEYVLQVFSEEQMGNWCERVYSRDSEYKYILLLTEGVTAGSGTSYYNYPYALQGSRYAYHTYAIQNRFVLLDSQCTAGTCRRNSFAAYFGHRLSSDSRKIRVTASERYYHGHGYTSGAPHQSTVPIETTGAVMELAMDTGLIVNDPQYFCGTSHICGLDLTDVVHAIAGTLNLNNYMALRELNVSREVGQMTLNALPVGSCRSLQ